jgi:serine/threonine protein kinase
LIFRLLTKQPEERITLEQALAHPWFRKIRSKYERHNTGTTSPDVMRGTGRSFNSGSPLKATEGAQQ